jgi:DNA invertase Pin-like site-specific DNA recombinase
MRGLELVDLVTDSGVSGGKPLSTRDGGRGILDLVRRRKVNAVIAVKLDRLFRNAHDCLDVTNDWDRSGVALHLLDLGGQSIDTSTAMGRFFLTVIAGAAEMERNLIRERTRAALAHKARSGQRVGCVPFGKRIGADGVHLEDDPAEQAAIDRITALHREGLSVREIAARLNAEQVKARGKRWHKTTVCDLIRRAA